MGSLPARSPKTFGGRLGTHSWVWVNPLCDPKMDGFRVERSKHDPNLWVIPQLRSGFDPWKLARSELRLDRDGCKQLQTWFRRPQTTADVEVPTSTKEIISIPFFSTKNRPVLFHSHRWHLFALSPSGTSASFYECGPTPLGQAELDVHTAIVEEYAQDAGSTVQSGMGKEKQERFSTVAIHRTAS